MQTLEEIEDTCYGYELSRSEEWEDEHSGDEEGTCEECAHYVDDGYGFGTCAFSDRLTRVGMAWGCPHWEPGEDE